jgi:hypothetical protein
LEHDDLLVAEILTRQVSRRNAGMAEAIELIATNA